MLCECVTCAAKDVHVDLLSEVDDEGVSLWEEPPGKQEWEEQD